MESFELERLHGTQALHTTVLPVGAEGLARVECQIRSADMHRQAMKGMMGEGPVPSILS